jgi:hypothetical protein
MSDFGFLPDDDLMFFEEGLLEFLHELDSKMNEALDAEEETIINQVA